MSEIRIITDTVHTMVIQITEYAIRLGDGTIYHPPLRLLTLQAAEDFLAVCTPFDFAGELIGAKVITRAVFRSEWTEVPR